MQKYIHYEKWTGQVVGHTREKSDRCIKADMPADDIYSYIVFEDKLYKRDNLVKTPLEKKLSIIEYGKKATVKINIFPDDAILKIIIDKYYIQTFIDPNQFDRIQFIHPVLKIYIHSKKSPQLLGTLEIDLDEYFKTGKYEQDISTILSKVNITDLVFKTQRCFEKYAYEINKNIAQPKVVDRNLIDNNIHLEITRCDTEWDLLVKNHIRFWQEFDSVLNDKITIFFTDKKDRNKLEGSISFRLADLKRNEYLICKLGSSLDRVKNINLEDKVIHVNKNYLNITYTNENTSN